jgi:hypothetical protein
MAGHSMASHGIARHSTTEHLTQQHVKATRFTQSLIVCQLEIISQRRSTYRVPKYEILCTLYSMSGLTRGKTKLKMQDT